jgi:hypothetical protein
MTTSSLPAIGLADHRPASPQPPATSTRFREAFTDFVGQTFFGELLKQMRATVDQPSLVHGGMGEEIFQSQLDQILVERMTDASGRSFSDPMFELLMARR